MAAAFQFRYTDPEGARFAEHSWDHVIGMVVPARLREAEGGPVRAELGEVRLIAAEVIEDGAAVLLTLEPVE